MNFLKKFLQGFKGVEDGKSNYHPDIYLFGVLVRTGVCSSVLFFLVQWEIELWRQLLLDTESVTGMFVLIAILIVLIVFLYFRFFFLPHGKRNIVTSIWAMIGLVFVFIFLMYEYMIPAAFLPGGLTPFPF